MFIRRGAMIFTMGMDHGWSWPHSYVNVPFQGYNGYRAWF